MNTFKSEFIKIRSKREVGMASILWGLPAFNAFLLPVVFWYENGSFLLGQSQMIALMVLIVLTAAAFYTWYYIFYIIEGHRLRYRAGIFSGSLDVRNIVSVLPSKYPSAGIRPAISTEGLLIHCSGGQQLFVSPVNEAAFRGALQKINQSIVIKHRNT